MNHARHVAGGALDDGQPVSLNCNHYLSSYHSCTARGYAVVSGRVECFRRARDIDSLVYDKLRHLAASHLRGEPRAHAFDPTDLVSEVYLRLVGAHLEFTDQTHFFVIASRTMRRILVDHARKQFAAKRGSGGRPVGFDETHIATDRPRELVTLGDALEELVRFDERKARVTVLRYFGGLTHEEIATVCGIHTNTVARDLRLSEAWLRGRFET